MIPAPGSDPHRSPSNVGPLPDRVEWPRLRPRGLDFFVGLLGIMVSWVPARDLGFASLSTWYAVTMVAAYALVVYVAFVGLSMLFRWLTIVGRRLRQYDALYRYAEDVRGTLTQHDLDVRRLARTVLTLSNSIGEATYAIVDVTTRDDTILLVLALGGGISPRSGQRLLVLDRRRQLVLGHLRVTGVTASSVEAEMENPEPVWLGRLHDIISQQMPFETTAIAILTDVDETGVLP